MRDRRRPQPGQPRARGAWAIPPTAAAIRTVPARASNQVDGALVQVRWVLILLGWALFAVTTRTVIPQGLGLAWMALVLLFNLALFLLVRRKKLPPSLPAWSLVGDIVLFGCLPYLAPANSSVFFLFGLWPTIVAALRFGAWTGTWIALLLTLPFGLISLAAIPLPPPLVALAAVVPEPIRTVLAGLVPSDVSLTATGVPIFSLFVVVILVGYLAQQEREVAAGLTTVELEQLRRGLAGAQMLYKMTDTLSETLSYSHVLESMLEAGTVGMPPARREDGPPVGVVFFFESNDSERNLHVVAWRDLEKDDLQIRIPGKRGVVSQALETGKAVTFAEAPADPEIGLLASMRRCHQGACFPLQAGLNQYGVVVLATPAPRPMSEYHLSLMRAFTNQAAVAFQNARLYQSLREERDRIIDTEGSARAKLARDLHDGPTQSVAALAMRLEYAKALVDRDPEKAKTELAEAREDAVRIGKELRELLFALRPLTLETQGLSPTLVLWAQRLQQAEQVLLEMNAGDLGPELDVKIAGTVFAIIEEAVNNARKHAQGARIQVQVCKQGDNLVATIRDQGPGFDLAAVEKSYDRRGSLGLVNMRERAKLLDGHLAIDSWPGRGTQVVLVVPLGGREG